MRNRLFLGLIALPTLLLFGGTGITACGSSDELGSDFAPNDSGNGGANSASSGTATGGATDETTTGSGTTTTTTTGTVGSATTAVGAGGGSGEFGEEPPPPPQNGNDAGADPDAAMPTCEGLDKDKPVVLYLSADDSNSMSSPAHAREFIKNGAAPPAWTIRTYEFLNYYRIKYPAPAPPLVQIFPQLENSDIPGELNLQLGVRSFDATKPRRPMTVTFILDTSGSMAGSGIDRERAAIKAVAASLAKGDIVNMVTWNTDNLVALEGYSVTGPNDAKVLSVANTISASGGTDLHGGLVKGYELAKKHYGKSRLNRVMLVSDGGANVGVTDEDLIADNSFDADQEGIYLVGVGTGPAGNYNDLLMDTVTDKGRGAYIYLDRPEEAAHMFTQRFDETMEIAARGVQVELTLPWYFKMHKFYGEEYSENPKEIEPQHLAPGDAMIFNQVIKACDPAEIQTSDTITVKATWEAPLTYEKYETTVSMTVADLLAAPTSQLQKGKAIVAYAEALKAGTKDALHAAHDAVVTANAGKDAELDEIAALLQKHPAY